MHSKKKKKKKTMTKDSPKKQTLWDKREKKLSQTNSKTWLEHV